VNKLNFTILRNKEALIAIIRLSLFSEVGRLEDLLGGIAKLPNIRQKNHFCILVKKTTFKQKERFEADKMFRQLSMLL
jgi:hypothetical protein